MIRFYKFAPYGLSILAISLLEGCKSMDQLATIGGTPPLTHIQNPTAASDYQPITMPMPTPQAPVQRVNSLWQGGARAFFKDQRASRVGDILTVLVVMEDKADLKNNTTTQRQTQEQMGVTNFFGLEGNLKNFLPKAVDPKNLITTNNNPQHTGTATVSRQESISLKLAARVTQVMPNGNLVIDGRQEFRVNYDVRELVVHGIVRPEDIRSDNTISYDRIDQARISYGGRGNMDAQQQPKWGHQVLDAILPF